ALYRRPLASADRTCLARRKRPAATLRALLDALEHAEQLADTAHEQPLLVDLDPRAGRRRKHDVVAWLDRHLHADAVPPVESGPDREHDPVLRRRLLGARRNDQARAPHSVRIEFLDHDAIEKRAELVAHGTR